MPELKEVESGHFVACHHMEDAARMKEGVQLR
jgi:hypothetical protein